ncbi:MAG TPA: GntR family transcriptional regulator [Clostridia bacterium]|nr:GntR family transcriptional regulator [Clostridia bacterium]
MTQYKTLAQSVYEELKRKILSKEYDANEHVSEKSIAAQLNVSKTPVREALNQLCQEGYITRYPSFGYIIKDLSYQEVKDIFELRYILETAAIRLVIRYAKDEEIRTLYDYMGSSEDSVTDGYGKNTRFHWELGKLTGNAYLANDILHLAMSIARPSKYLDSGDNRKPSMDFHVDIINALLARDIDVAIAYLKKDILTGEHREC